MDWRPIWKEFVFVVFVVFVVVDVLQIRNEFEGALALKCTWRWCLKHRSSTFFELVRLSAVTLSNERVEADRRLTVVSKAVSLRACRQSCPKRSKRERRRHDGSSGFARGVWDL